MGKKDKFIMHKWWGLCKIIKRIDKHGYVVQSSKRNTGDYLNVDDWNFVPNGVNECVKALINVEANPHQCPMCNWNCACHEQPCICCLN